MTKLMRLVGPPEDGWEDLVGTYWVLQGDGKTLRHVTERQSQIKITMRSKADVPEYFEEVGTS